MSKASSFIYLYQIVPINDGYHCVYRDDSGKHLLEHKAAHGQKHLMFYSEEVAQAYIVKYLDGDTYKTEMCIYNVRYLPDNIITDKMWQESEANGRLGPATNVAFGFNELDGAVIIDDYEEDD
jgi:hypothetical protein